MKVWIDQSLTEPWSPWNLNPWDLDLGLDVSGNT
jgi:hypothetical protein